MIINAPAKINLYLKILSKRDDGYHEIETLFERVSLCDRISIEFAQDHTSITCDDPRVPTDEESLMGRAVAAFIQRANTKKHFRVILEKYIPVGAGLGGGSSDVAALLKGLNELEGHPLNGEELVDIGGNLGADIPFFLSDNRFAYGKGRGDIIEGVETSLDLWHILINPPFEVSAGAVYSGIRAFGLTKNEAVDRMFTAFVNNNNSKYVVENLHNDLQQVVIRDFPVLERVFSELRKTGAKGVLLSGSGPTVFGIFDPGRAESAGEKLRKVFRKKEGWGVFVVKTY